MPKLFFVALAASFLLLGNQSFAQKSRRALKNDLTVQASAPVGGALQVPVTSSTGVTSVTAGTGVTAVTGGTGRSDSAYGLSSAGKGVYVAPIVASTATVPLPIPAQDTQQQNPLLSMLQGLFGSMSGQQGQTAASGKTTPTTTTPVTTTPATTTPATTTASNPSGTTDPNKIVNDPAGKIDAKDPECDSSTGLPKPIGVHSKFRVSSCTFDAKGSFGLNFRGNTKRQAYDAKAIAPGTIVFAGYQGGYGCRLIVKHDKCPIPAVEKSGVCYSSYGNIAKTEGKDKCPGEDENPELKVGAKVSIEQKLGRTDKDAAGDYYGMNFEFHNARNEAVAPNKYLCNFTSHSQFDKEASRSRCGADKDTLQSASTIGPVDKQRVMPAVK